MRFYFLFCVCLASALAAPAGRAAEPNSLCRNAAAAAERRFSIPQGLLQAIALVETGHARRGETSAWPWTVNVNGKGRYFKTRTEAEKFVLKKTQAGETAIDIGCFQINAKWHGTAFASTTKMLDPESAAVYAATFLTKLHKEFGEWDEAVRNYHSRTKNIGARYGRKVAAARNDVAQSGKPAVAAPFLAALMPSTRSVRAGGVDLKVFFSSRPIIEAAAAPPFFSEKP